MNRPIKTQPKLPHLKLKLILSSMHLRNNIQNPICKKNSILDNIQERSLDERLKTSCPMDVAQRAIHMLQTDYIRLQEIWSDIIFNHVPVEESHSHIAMNVSKNIYYKVSTITPLTAYSASLRKGAAIYQRCQLIIIYSVINLLIIKINVC